MAGAETDGRRSRESLRSASKRPAQASTVCGGGLGRATAASVAKERAALADLPGRSNVPLASKKLSRGSAKSQVRSLYQTPLLVQAKKVEFSRSPFSGGLGEFTPAPSCAAESVGRSEAAHEKSSTPEQRAQVTPPVQPSICPEIHSQEVAQDAGKFFSAGHVRAPVSSKGKVKDRRKCRPIGILICGEAKPLPLDDDHPRFSLLPDPAVAFVKWFSPRQGRSQSSPSNGASPESVNSQGSPPMCYNKKSSVSISV